MGTPAPTLEAEASSQETTWSGVKYVVRKTGTDLFLGLSPAEDEGFVSGWDPFSIEETTFYDDEEEASDVACDGFSEGEAEAVSVSFTVEIN